jgi:acetyl esterase/lipase
MLNKTIPVGVDGSSATITSYVFAPTEDAYALKPLPAVVVVPGGGYDHVSPREGEPVALRLLAMGYQAFVLNYSVAPAVYPLALQELARSIPSEAMRQSTVSILIGLRSWVFRPVGI